MKDYIVPKDMTQEGHDFQFEAWKLTARAKLPHCFFETRGHVHIVRGYPVDETGQVTRVYQLVQGFRVHIASFIH